MAANPGDMQAVLQTIGEDWGLHLSETELDQYSALVSECVEDMRSVRDLPSDEPPRDHIGERTWHEPSREKNKYNAWYVKTDIQLKTEGKLAGRRVAIKDNICVAGVPMMSGSELFRGFTPDYDATLVTRLLQEGAVLAGKATCEDLCHSGGSFTSATGPVLNPHDVTKMTGGSSSGCAALVAAGELELAIGGDQGGSIRTPSSWCGIVGLKPSHGLVPYTGAASLVPRLDHLGPMTANVRDCALLLEIIAGRDGFDSRQKYTFEVPNYSQDLTTDVSSVRIGLLQEGFHACAPEVTDVVRRAADRLRPLVCSVEDISIPYCQHGPKLMNVVFWSGAYETVVINGGQAPLSGGHQDMALFTHCKKYYKERLQKLDPSVKLALFLGEYMKRNNGVEMSCEAANKVNQLRKDIDVALENHDVLIMPTLPILPPPFPERDITISEYVLATTEHEKNTGICDLTGHPALTINAGYVGGLPVGMMIVAKHWHEQTILNLALAWETIRDSHVDE